MSESGLTALATVLLVLVGGVQIAILLRQRHQQRLDWAETYRRRWIELAGDWAVVVFLGRRASDYYQIAHHEHLRQLHLQVETASSEAANSWAQASVRNVCGMLSDLCARILQGHVNVRDVYPFFGTELLRQGAPLRALLDGRFDHLQSYGTSGPTDEERAHDRLRSEMTMWLICHDGIRRRCLIMIDLLWAEAARLEDLPPHELMTAADAKALTGGLNRARVWDEARRLNSWWSFTRSTELSNFLRHSEWRSHPWSKGLSRQRLKALDQAWSERYVRPHS